jgi:TRAP-type transport system periplasmic protein
VNCLNLPMFFDTYEQLDYVRHGIAAELDKSFEQHGYKVLNWAEAGWVHFFAKSPVRTPDDLRALRMWIGTGDPKAERLAKELGFRAVPLPTTDMLTGLQAGLIEVIDVPPLFALLDRSFQAAPYMTDLRFAPLIAATVITLPAWERIPAKYRDSLLEASQAAAARLRSKIHAAEGESIAEMQSRGLHVVEIDGATIAEWRRESEAIYPHLDCAMQYPELFTKVLTLQRESAARGGAAARGAQ